MLPNKLFCPISHHGLVSFQRSAPTTHRPQAVSMMAFPGSRSRRHVSSSSSGSSETGDARSWDSCSISRRSSSSVFVLRLAERSSFVTNTFAWDTGFFWRRSGQSLLKCPMRRQRKHLVFLRICSISGAGVGDLELWLKLRSRLTMFRFCRDSFQVTRVRTASSSSIGHDSSVVFLSISNFVIRASISPESTSDVDCSSRGNRGSSQSSMT